MELTNAAILLNMAITLLALGGGYLAFRQAGHQQTSTLQSQAIDALKAEIEVLQERGHDLERENTRLNTIIGLIKNAMCKSRMKICIDGDLVTFTKGDDGDNIVARIQEREG